MKAFVVSCMIVAMGSFANGIAAAKDALDDDIIGNYVCRISAMAGMKWSSQEHDWVSATFNPDDRSYLVKLSGRKRTSSETQTWDPYQLQIKRLGNKAEFETCRFRTETDLRMSGNVISCEAFEEYQFNFIDKRMAASWFGDIAYGGPGILGDGYIVSGACDKID